MRRIFQGKRNKYMFSDRRENEEKATTIKIRDIVIGMIILFVFTIIKLLSSGSFQISYWIGLILRLVIFIPLLIVAFFVIRNIIMLFIRIIEDIIHKKIRFIVLSILAANIMAFVLFLYAANYFKVISYAEDVVTSCNHSYSVIEGKIIGMEAKYDWFARKQTVCGVIFTVQNESGEIKTITFNGGNLYNAVGMGDYCSLEYLPHSIH